MFWDFAARTYYRLLERVGSSLNPIALEKLDVRPGEVVLDIGCGTGVLIPALAKAVGPQGRVVAMDYSVRMVAIARKRARAYPNVEVRHADACRTDHGFEEFDAAVALGAFSAMADVPAAIENAHAALKPGGRMFVFDVRLIKKTRGTKVLRETYRLIAGFTGVDVIAELREKFAVAPVFAVEGDTWTTVMATKVTDTASRSAHTPSRPAE